MPAPRSGRSGPFSATWTNSWRTSSGADWSRARGGAGRLLAPHRNLLKDGEHIVRAGAARLRPREVVVNVAGNTLAIRGERKVEEKNAVNCRRFSQTLTLPETADPEKVKATLAHGLLEIRIPASPQLVGKKIPVEAGSGETHKAAQGRVKPQGVGRRGGFLLLSIP